MARGDLVKKESTFSQFSINARPFKLNIEIRIIKSFLGLFEEKIFYSFCLAPIYILWYTQYNTIVIAACRYKEKDALGVEPV